VVRFKGKTGEDSTNPKTLFYGYLLICVLCVALGFLLKFFIGE